MKDDKSYKLIDFEYSTYNYRGYDLGNYCNEMIFDYNEPNTPYFRL